MHVHNPMIRPGSELTPALLEAEIAKSYKMRGYLLDHPEVVDRDGCRHRSVIRDCSSCN